MTQSSSGAASDPDRSHRQWLLALCCARLAKTKNASAPDKAIAGLCMPLVLATLASSVRVPSQIVLTTFT